MSRVLRARNGIHYMERNWINRFLSLFCLCKKYKMPAALIEPVFTLEENLDIFVGQTNLRITTYLIFPGLR